MGLVRAQPPVGISTELDIAPGSQGWRRRGGLDLPAPGAAARQPGVWWLGTLAALWSVVAGVVKRDWRHVLVLVGLAATWLPWFRYDDRPIFSYYASVSLPFLVLSLTLAVGRRRWSRRAAPAAPRGRRGRGRGDRPDALAFAWFWPIWTDELLTNGQWLDRMWFRRWI